MVAQAVFILEMPRLENFSPILNGSKISQEFASYMKEKHQVTFKATFNGKDQEEPWLLENASKLDDIFGKFKQTNAWTEYGKTLSWDQRNH